MYPERLINQSPSRKGIEQLEHLFDLIRIGPKATPIEGFTLEDADLTYSPDALHEIQRLEHKHHVIETFLLLIHVRLILNNPLNKGRSEFNNAIIANLSYLLDKFSRFLVIGTCLTNDCDLSNDSYEHRLLLNVIRDHMTKTVPESQADAWSKETEAWSNFKGAVAQATLYLALQEHAPMLDFIFPSSYKEARWIDRKGIDFVVYSHERPQQIMLIDVKSSGSRIRIKSISQSKQIMHPNQHRHIQKSINTGRPIHERHWWWIKYYIPLNFDITRDPITLLPTKEDDLKKIVMPIIRYFYYLDNSV